MSQNEMRTGIIIAAGLGSRLDNSNPTIKLLIPIEGIPLLIRIINSHEIAGCKDIVIVLGWQAELIENAICAKYDGPLELRFAYNQRYNLQNGLSVLAARPFIDNEFILTMADHIIDDKIMRQIQNLHAPKAGAILCVDYKLTTIFDIDDATKVLSDGNSIKRIGKELDVFNCVDTGVFIGTDGLMNALAQIYNKKGDVSLSEGMQLLADSDRAEALDIKDAFWQDVDTPQMLDNAEKLLCIEKKQCNNFYEKITL